MIKKNIRPIITIDGPAASGKGTISKSIAEYFNFYNLETGIFYRVIAKEFKKNNSNNNIKRFLDSFKKNIFDVSRSYKRSLYTEAVAKKASELAKLEVIRSYVLLKQIQTIKSYPKKFKGIILEGRDCGTVIAPKADIKFFLNAKVEIRAKRRYKQLLMERDGVTYKKVYLDLLARDKNDRSRLLSPLKIADDANEIDCSNTNIEETIMIVKKIILSKLPYFKLNKEIIDGK